ncbi:argininosuccinate synthase [Desulfurispira natronophila]|uniref:Argininosuccinate synthase n=1 Tax=Desulfurispira natronophila TaxID=682562 RepID=A0A7W7Y6D3_9BACT|nr:argininosuccinate synthase [Desulfurispira natronophila]MBB5022779.1 argininosuccinate synthase [Desulfurispira natronophila]
MANKDQVNKVVLAYSGGLDTSVILKWLIKEYDCEVIAFTADLGQEEELDSVEPKALKTGASKVYITDLRDEFASDFIYPMMRSSCIYEGRYLLGTSIARPLITKGMMDVVAKEGAQAISHGATGKGNDQVRFELAAYHFDPSIKVIAPWREWDLNSRDALVKFAKDNDIEIPPAKKSPYSRDRNLMHISHEGNNLEDPWWEPDEDVYVLSVSPENAPDKPTWLELEFEKGDVVAINGERMTPLQVFQFLNKVGGANGVGRLDLLENRYVGMKSRGVYETPGGTIYYEAHRGMEELTMDREVMNLRDSLIPRYAGMVYNGYWFSPEREALQALIDETQKTVNGTVRVKIYKGNVTVTGRKSATDSLFDANISTFEEDHQVYNQADAEGFIKLNALRLKIRSKLYGAKK